MVLSVHRLLNKRLIELFSVDHDVVLIFFEVKLVIAEEKFFIFVLDLNIYFLILFVLLIRQICNYVGFDFSELAFGVKQVSLVVSALSTDASLHALVILLLLLAEEGPLIIELAASWAHVFVATFIEFLSLDLGELEDLLSSPFLPFRLLLKILLVNYWRLLPI